MRYSVMHCAAAALCLAIGAVAAAQTAPGRAPGLNAEPETTPTLIPEIPAEHEDPMDREPDPAAGTPAATGWEQPDPASEQAAECDETSAETATGVPLCPEEPASGS